MVRRFLAFVSGILWRRRATDEANEELQFHIEQEIEANVRLGLSPADAKLKAVRDLGGLTQTAEAVSDVRMLWVDALWRDIRYSARTMRRTPGFTALAVLMLALGTGANIAVFTVIDRVVLRSPFPEPRQLALVQIVEPSGRLNAFIPTDRAAALSAAPRTLAAVARLGGGSHLMTGVGDPQRPDFECVSASMFEVLGTPPLAGRTFSPHDDFPGAPPTIVLSFDFAQRLGQPQDLIGRTLTLNQRPVTIIGVMPEGFDGPFSRSDTEGWLPLGVTLTGSGLTGCAASTGVNMFARVGRGYTLEEAERALPGIRLTSLQGQTFEEYWTPFLILSAAVVLVLLIACLNVGGLQIERAVARRSEMALRSALGASRGRLLRQALTESFVLAAVGGVGGVGATFVTLKALVALLPMNIPHRDQIAVNGDVLLAAVAAVAVTTFVSGIFPMLAVMRFDPWRAAQGAGRRLTSSGGWTRRLLVTTEIALSIVVLISAGLMIQTFLTLRPSRPGFDPVAKQVSLVRLPGATPDASARFFAQLFNRIRAIDGVREVSGSSYLPMWGTVSTVPVTLDTKTVTAFGAAITPEYLSSMRIPIVAGRAFTSADTSASLPVALVNEEFARRLAPGASLVGRRVLAAGPRRANEPPIEREIVGVIANTRSNPGHTRPAGEFYVPYAQSPTPVLYVVAEATPRQFVNVAAEIRRAIRELQPDLVIEPVEPLQDVLNRRVAIPRLGAWLLGIFAGLAVSLAAIGLMTTIGWWVSQRTRELSIRIALGATHARVARLLFGQGLWLVLTGIAVGCLLAATVTRYLQGWIYGITPLDGRTFAAAAGFMGFVALMAIAVPMRRALKLDPVTALKME